MVAMYDVIVVGAGPAGASAARRCAQLGLGTLLIDKAVFPRPKLCGGALSEQAMSYLDFDLPGELIEHDVYGARLHFGGTCIEIKKPYRIAVLVSRTRFDHFLLEKAAEAGARIIQGKRVSALDRDRDGVRVIVGKDSYRGRIVIGSDGFHSVTARYVRRKHRKNEYGICVASRIPGGAIALDIHDVVDIHFGVAGEGYGWVFPHKGYFSVGIGGSASRMSNPQAAMRRFLASTGLPTDVKMRGFPIPAGGVRRDIVADRLLLTGDAAGFVDAFTGEGIAYAIRSGQLAGEVAATALESGSCCVRALDLYRVRCDREFGRDLRYSLHSARLMHRFPGLFLRLMASDAEILGRYLEVPARRSSYQKYLAWLLPRIPCYVARLMLG
jgi:geranylgeranyl reductase family protein